MPQPFTSFGESYEGVVAKIESTTIGPEDHGIFTAFVSCALEDGWHQGFGGYDLREGSAAATFIQKVLWAAEASSWEKLVGKTLVVYKKDRHSEIAGVGKLFPKSTDTPFMFSKLYG